MTSLVGRSPADERSTLDWAHFELGISIDIMCVVFIIRAALLCTGTHVIIMV